MNIQLVVERDFYYRGPLGQGTSLQGQFVAEALSVYSVLIVLSVLSVTSVPELSVIIVLSELSVLSVVVYIHQTSLKHNK